MQWSAINYVYPWSKSVDDIDSPIPDCHKCQDLNFSRYIGTLYYVQEVKKNIPDPSVKSAVLKGWIIEYFHAARLLPFHSSCPPFTSRTAHDQFAWWCMRHTAFEHESLRKCISASQTWRDLAAAVAHKGLDRYVFRGWNEDGATSFSLIRCCF